MYNVYNTGMNNLKKTMKKSGDRTMTSGTERQFKIPKNEGMTTDKC
jgi:hypothetical protein